MYSGIMMDLPNKVKAALKKIPPFKKVVVGLSGGMDSVVLTHVLKHLGYEVIVAHLNHDLRGEISEKDEAFVIELAKAWKLPFVSNKAVIPKKGNLEQNARKIRYSFLEEVRLAYGADFVAVGHHFDDQIETLLMHEERGAGLRGKRGMSLVSGHLIRPMLDLPRRKIEAYAREHLLDFVIDETNMDMSFQWNYLRHQVIPTLKQEPDFEARMRKMAHEAAEKIEALKEPKKHWMMEKLKNNSFDRGEFSELEPDLKAEILLELLGQQDLYQANLNRLMDFIDQGATGKTLEVKGLSFVIEYDRAKFTRQKVEALHAVEVKKNAQWGDYVITVKAIQPLVVRPWKPGDKFQPAGMGGTKKLQDFFVDQKIPREERKRIPIVVDENDAIICVGDLRFSEGFKGWKDRVKVRRNSKAK